MARRKSPRIPDAILDQLLAGADPKTALDANGLLDDLKKALAERALNAEMDHHLAGDEGGNSRNGYGRKTVTTDTGRIELEIPRDRPARFDPKLIAKYQRRFPGFDDKIISMYARGMSVREIRGHLAELYGIDVSPDLISAVTDAVLEEVAAWQTRPLEPVYPLVFFDAIRVKIRDEGFGPQQGRLHRAWRSRRRHQGDPRPLDRAERGRQVLAPRHERAEEPRHRGHSDRRRRWPERLPRSDQCCVPANTVQTCIVHLIRHSLDFVSCKDRKPVPAASRRSTERSTQKLAKAALDAFEASFWGQQISGHRPELAAQLEPRRAVLRLPRRVRRILYTTNAIEALNAKLRRAVRVRGHFPNDDAAMKLLYLVLNRGEKEWKMPPREWFDGQDPIRRRLRRALHTGHGGLIGSTRRPHTEIPDSPT